MRKLIPLLLIFCQLNAFASHIVGGEFELLHLSDIQYRLNMVLYFDRLNGNPGAEEQSVTVFIYRKSDNTLMNQLVLNLQTNESVPYTNAACDDGELITARLFYTNTLSLAEDVYNDPEGYYIAWERCCRNYSLVNIFSDDPSTNGVSAGQTFYLEFPPVTQNGKPFINSTPRLFPPLRDYGCIDNFYFADFGGTDDDGDSLAYSLVTPYSTFDTQNAYPASPNPGPYPEVVWKSGFGIDNILNGEPNMSITERGVLRVTPQFAGLYVFAVKVEEFRDGVKHGEMRRDFQMLVVSDCGSGRPPTIRAKETDQTTFYGEGSTINFDFRDDEKCIDILVTDPPTNIGRDSISTVSIRAIPINFNAQLEGIEIDFSRNIELTSELDTARFTVCFPDCPYTRNGRYDIGIIALDGSCPQPALDTVVVSLNVPPPPNENAFFKINNAPRTNRATLVANDPNVNSESIWDLGAFDNDGDSVTLIIEPLGFDPALAGITFSEVEYASGQATTNIRWSTDCLNEGLDYSEGRDIFTASGISKAFDFNIRTEDKDECEWQDPQQLLLTLIVNFPNQTKPIIFTPTAPSASYLRLDFTYNELISLPIRGTDADGDDVRLTGRARNFNFSDFGISFPDIEGAGTPGVSGNFIWDIPCQFEAEIDSFRVQFLIEDIDACQLTNADTLNVDFIISPPINTAPIISLASLNGIDITNDTISVTVDEPIELNVMAQDNTGDSVLLDLFERNGNDPFIFERALGAAPVQSTFSWTPNCNDLTGPNFTREVVLNFIAIDQNCYEPQSSSYQLVIQVNDVDADEVTVLPPNVFTPNGDGSNDFFGMYQLDESGELMNILPIDNCAGQFEEVVIINRWGREVFRSEQRDFRWDGDGVLAGVYFYQISYTNKEYRGSVSIFY